jgi:hypothetical protein
MAFACIAAVYAITVFKFNPQYFFGATQDDSLYFSSAKALANHQGYILPSVPGGPAATKYPILYPWLLSWIWRWNPSFPANLRPAVGLTAAFGVLFLAASFLFLRRLKGISDPVALLLTFILGLHPIFLYYSSGVLSDVPFAGLAMLAMVLSDRAMRPESSGARSTGCAVVTGFSILMRAFGVPVAAGILAAAVARRAWRQAAIFCGTLIPFAGVVLWRWMFSAPRLPDIAAGSPYREGFLNVWAYYTSYQGFWKLSVPNAQILWAMLRSNILLVMHSPSEFFLDPWLSRGNIPSLALALLVTAAIFAGIVRLSRGGEWKTIHWVLPFYMALVLVWNFPNTERFAFLFLPLFLGGLWCECGHFLGQISSSFRRSKTIGEKAIAASLALIVAGLIGALFWNYAGGARPVMAEIASDRSSLLQEKREAYEWLACCTSRDDLVISYEDASLYLYSGRQGLRPVVFPTSGEYDPAYLRAALPRMMDVAHVIGARYWVIADDDFDLEWTQAGKLGRARENEIEPGLSLVFKSRGGRVRVYGLGCGDAQGGPACP